MEVVTLLLFVGAVWVVGAVAFFAWCLLTTHHQHSERLAVLPLEDNWVDARGSAASERLLTPQERKS